MLNRFEICKNGHEMSDAKMSCNWSGTYTKGWYCAMTHNLRIWFKSSYTESYRGSSGGAFSLNNDIETKSLIDDDCTLFCGDGFNIRHSSLELLIDDLECTNNSIKRIGDLLTKREAINYGSPLDTDFEEMIEKMKYDEMLDEKSVFINICPTENMFVFHNKNDTINELKFVLRISNECGVIFSDD